MKVILEHGHQLTQDEQYFFTMLSMLILKHNCLIIDIDFNNMLVDLDGSQKDVAFCIMELTSYIAQYHMGRQY